MPGLYNKLILLFIFNAYPSFLSIDAFLILAVVMFRLPLIEAPAGDGRQPLARIGHPGGQLF
jgi:hypothetical protein